MSVVPVPRRRFDREALRAQGLLLLGLLGLAAGGIAWALRSGRLASDIWATAALFLLTAVIWRIVRDLWAKKRPGVDVIALLAIAGSLATGERLAALLIGVMLATGEALESYAAARAHRELSALLSRVPRVAHRIDPEATVAIPVGEVRPGDRLLVKPGEIVPVDGLVTGSVALVDESALTGEALAVNKAAGDRVFSGTANAGAAFQLRAVATADDSTYAGIVRLVEQASTSRAPFVRLADRFAWLLIPFSLAIAALAWIASGDPRRAVAVLVVATPCPLLLAAPVALVSGISRAAARGIIIKGGAALEALARVERLLFDKTGTLTSGTPEITDMTVFSALDASQVLRLAASVAQASSHVLSSALVRAARDRGLDLSFPSEAAESPGVGIAGVVDGLRVRVGTAEWASDGRGLSDDVRVFRRRMTRAGAATVFVGVGDAVAGAVGLDDPIRPDSPATIRALRRAGIRKVVMVTGDHPLVAESVGAVLGVDKVLAQRSPAEKVAAVREARAQGPTVMVGDGINDAAALAAADVGVAMGARGSSAASEAADVVILVNRLDRLAEAQRIARRSRSIAMQSVFLGMGLSLVAMGFAAAGLLPPVAGALLQEGIDVVSIANALRARGGGWRARRNAIDDTMSRRLRSEHATLMPALDKVRTLADRLDRLEGPAARLELNALDAFLNDVLTHETVDDAEVYPKVAGVIGGEDPLSTMSRAHQEIFHLVRLYKRLLEDVDDTGPHGVELSELRRVLYGLHAVLRLHFAQEEQLYASLSDSYLEGTKADHPPA